MPGITDPAGTPRPPRVSCAADTWSISRITRPISSGGALYRFSTTSNTTIGFVGVGANPCDPAVSRGYGA